MVKYSTPSTTPSINTDELVVVVAPPLDSVTVTAPLAVKSNGPALVSVKTCAVPEATLSTVKALLETVTALPSLSFTVVLSGKLETVISLRLSLPSVSLSVAVTEIFLSNCPPAPPQMPLTASKLLIMILPPLVKFMVPLMIPPLLVQFDLLPNILGLIYRVSDPPSPVTDTFVAPPQPLI